MQTRGDTDHTMWERLNANTRGSRSTYLRLCRGSWAILDGRGSSRAARPGGRRPGGPGGWPPAFSSPFLRGPGPPSRDSPFRPSLLFSGARGRRFLRGPGPPARDSRPSLLLFSGARGRRPGILLFGLFFSFSPGPGAFKGALPSNCDFWSRILESVITTFILWLTGSIFNFSGCGRGPGPPARDSPFRPSLLLFSGARGRRFSSPFLRGRGPSKESAFKLRLLVPDPY